MENDCSPHLWQLKFNPAMINDSGTYLCHISTDPPLIRYIHLEISGNIWFIFKLLALPQPRLWCTTTHRHHRKFIQNPEHNFVRYRLFPPATSFIIRHSGGWIHLHQKMKMKIQWGKKGFRHQYSWVIFSFGYQVGRVVCHGQSVTHLSTGIWSLNGRRRQPYVLVVVALAAWSIVHHLLVAGKATLYTMT